MSEIQQSVCLCACTCVCEGGAGSKPDSAVGAGKGPACDSHRQHSDIVATHFCPAGPGHPGPELARFSSSRDQAS